MSVTTEGDERKDLTLAFELAAIEQFADPATVFADAREWSRYVGVIANDTEAVGDFLAAHDLQQDFDQGDRDKWLALADLREATATPRHVLVGTTTDARRAADQTGWEYLTVSEAAAKAGWRRGDCAAGSTGILDRVRAAVPVDGWWPFSDR